MINKIKQYFAPKYILVAFFGAFLMPLCLSVVTYGYLVVFDNLSTFSKWDILSVQAVFAGILFGYFSAYMHELIPHCSSPFFGKWIKFGLMLFIGVFSLLFLVSGFVNIYFFLFVIDLSITISLSFSALVVYVVYHFEPGRSIQKSGVCAIK